MFFESDQYAISTAFRSEVCLFEFAFFVFDLIEFYIFNNFKTKFNEDQIAEF